MRNADQGDARLLKMFDEMKKDDQPGAEANPFEKAFAPLEAAGVASMDKAEAGQDGRVALERATPGRTVSLGSVQRAD